MADPALNGVLQGEWWVNPRSLYRKKPFESAVRVRVVPNLDERCQRCAHRLEEHHWDGSLGGRCCYEVDRYELCACKRFVKPTPESIEAKAQG